MNKILSQTTGVGATKAYAKRKLDCLGALQGASCFANDPKRLKLLRDQLELASSIASINKAQAEEKHVKAQQATASLMEKAPGALEKLKAKGGDLSKITMPELESLAFRFFGGAALKSKTKGPMVAEVRGLVIKHRAANPLSLSDESLSRALRDDEDPEAP
jgi:hypothetical protein